ncbi:sodium-dependent phosphate transporter 1-B-like isoform X2 [Gigantopelta aegis]|nr:sodium-dependent phosphate transporter 1-B-like isoform X2 [Gigantopelta aegis]
MRKGIVDVTAYNGSEALLMVGSLSALSGSCVMLIGATIAGLPISATHSIVGATIGFSLVAQGTRGIGWKKLGLIIGSWFISPIMSGLVSAVIFMIIRKLVLNNKNSLQNGLKLLPVFYGLTVFINAFSVFYDGSRLLHFDKIPIYGVIILSVGSGVIVALIIRFFVVPRQQKAIESHVSASQSADDTINSSKNLITGREITSSEKKTTEKKLSIEDRNHNTNRKDKEMKSILLIPEYKPDMQDSIELKMDTSFLSSESAGSDESMTVEVDDPKEKHRDSIEDKPETAKLFSFLQVLTAVFGSFAHGGNDVSNAIGPVVALWIIATEGSVAQKAPTPIWILFFGGVGISVGLCILGRRVMKTIGEDLSKITPSSGFCIEIGAALTVLVASNAGIPISTTHCKVGSIVSVGRVRSNENVDWKLFKNIILAWLVTLPIAGGVSAAVMAGLRELI